MLKVSCYLIGFGFQDAGVRCQASGSARMELHEFKQRTAEPQNIEYRISNVEGRFRFAQSFFYKIDRIRSFDIHYSIFDIRYSLFQSFFFD
jgi:hypothetical protein